MAAFLMGLFAIQLLLLLYQFTFLADAGHADRLAPATRIPGGMVLGQLTTSVLGMALWLGYRVYGDEAWAWCALATTAITAVIGLSMDRRTRGASPVINGELTAESRIPDIAQGLLVVVTLALFVLVLLVAAGVF
ncbi:MAG: hypothetical protein QM638_21755 [Nocardioides sp.]|uniref:hypothetical protein n=1 Tax=Nocardioides sp. TaxID=35761 RepID=UPI0039E38971